MAKQSPQYYFTIVVLLSAVLCGCQAISQTTQTSPVSAEVNEHPMSPALTPLGGLGNVTVSATDVDSISVQRMDLAVGVTPLYITDDDHAYAIMDDEASVLWQYCFSTSEAIPIVDVRENNTYLAVDIACNGQWLVWLETENTPVVGSSILWRTTRLMLRDLRLGVDYIVDTDTHTASDGFSLPFDHLYIEESYLLYRHSSFKNGWRDTSVVLVDLASTQHSILMKASGAEGDTILNCSMQGKLVAWDVQSAYQLRVGSLPALPRARYSIYMYQLDMETGEEGAYTIVTQNRGYYAPYVHEGKLFVISLQYIWFDEPGRERRYSNPEDRYKEIGYESTIELIDPKNYSVQRVVYEHEHSAAILGYFADIGIPRSIYRDNPYIGIRFLSWKSNVAEQHVVFDMREACYVELPLQGFEEGENYQNSNVRTVRGTYWCLLRCLQVLEPLLLRT